MTEVLPPAPPANLQDPEFRGPYDPANGACADGHPVNGFGRCARMNAGTCLPSFESHEMRDDVRT